MSVLPPKAIKWLAGRDGRKVPETDFNRHCRTSISNFSIHFGKQLCQIADLDILKRPHGVLDIPAQLHADMACCELVELGADLLAAEWPRRKSGIIRYLVVERLTAFEPDGHPASELGRKAGRKALVWPYLDLQEKTLDILVRNPLRRELCRLNIAIIQGNRQQVGGL